MRDRQKRYLCFAFIVQLVWGLDTQAENIFRAGDSISTASVHRIIHQTYKDVLGREPDGAGLSTYTDYLVHEGKDADWLQHVLRESREGQAVRQRKIRQRITLVFILIFVIVGCILAGVFRRQLARCFRLALDGITPKGKQYLAGSVFLSPVFVFLSLILFYVFIKSEPPDGWILCGLVVTVGMIAARMPRWIVYTVVIGAFVALLGWSVFVDANRSHDATSDRDDAVEIGAKALLAGENPWTSKSILNLPITTGPSSILVAVPFVRAVGKINPLTFFMWCVFVATIVFADIRCRNNSFLTVCVLLLLPWSGFRHTMHWSLDELYYAAILAPFLWFALSRQHLVFAGVLGGFMILSRLSYAPAVLATGMWWLFQKRRRFKEILRVAWGGTGYVLIVLLLFFLVGGADFIQDNFWNTSQMPCLNSDNNALSAFVTFLLSAFPQSTLGSAILVLIVTTVAAWGMRSMRHPFYHMAVASLLAHTVSFSPAYRMDYQLIFLIPALYGICFCSLPLPLSGHEVVDADDAEADACVQAGLRG